MEYESDYSKNHIHFVTQVPEWKHLLKIDDQFYERILDLGAGGGRNSIYLRQLYPEATIVPLDLSVIRCAACRQNVNAGVTCGNSMNLPFFDNSFDLVVSTQVIEHVPDDHIFVKELERVLKPTGVSIISSVVKLRFGWYFYRNRRGEWVLDPTHEREYSSVKQYADLFREFFPNVSLYTDYFDFSVARFFYRSLIKMGIIRKPDPKFFANTKTGDFLEKWRITIPRYRLVTVVAKK
jgi:ubiquinone/menaquinone biosynthesis C-methylase UbiE